MWKYPVVAAALALAALPVAATAQDSAAIDCVAASASEPLKASIVAALGVEGSEESRDAVFVEVVKLTDVCAAQHGIADTHKRDYVEYSLSRIARELLIPEIANAGLTVDPIDQALDFGPGRTNPDLSGNLSDDQIMLIVQAYIDSGVDIAAIDSKIWEKVGAYTAVTSIYWNKRKLLPF